MFGKDYDEVYALAKELNVHGGLTFSDRCTDFKNWEGKKTEEEVEAEHICHPKQGAANEEVWWLGFDCAHYNDLCPAYDDGTIYTSSTYKPFEYVKGQVTQLALQIFNYKVIN